MFSALVCALVLPAFVDGSWLNPVDGDWDEPTNWNGGVIPDVTATVGLSGVYTVEIDSAQTIETLLLTNPDATVAVRGGQTFSINSGATIDGLLDVNSNTLVADALVLVSDGATLDGTGAINLGGPTSPNDARLDITGTVTSGSDLTIVANDQGLITGTGTLLMNGEIRAETGAFLRIDNTVVLPSTAFLRGVDGTVALGDGARVEGGIFQSSGAGSIEATSGTSTVVGVENRGTLDIRGGILLQSEGIENDGTIVVNSNTIVADAVLVVADATGITGSGSVHLQGTSSVADARVDVAGNSLLSANQTITAVDRGRLLGGGTLTANGVLEAGVGGTLNILDLTVDLSGGGVVRADDTGTVELDDGSVFVGGTFNTSGTGIVNANGDSDIDGAINMGHLAIRGGASILCGDLENNGTLEVNNNNVVSNALLTMRNGSTIDGTGEIIFGGFSGTDDAQIVVEGDVVTAFGAGQTIRGFRGRITGEGTIFSEATISVDDTGSTQIHGVLLDQSAGGRLLADATGQVEIMNDAMIVGGTFEAINDGMVVVESGDVTITDVVNQDGFGVRGGAGAVVTNFTNNGEVTLNTNGVVSNSIVILTDGTTIGGTGTLIFNGFSSTDDAQFSVALDETATYGADQIIVGRSGRFAGEGTHVIDADLEPGLDESFGNFGINAIVEFGAGITTTIDLGGTGSSEFDRFTGNGTVTLDGDLVIVHADGYTPAFGDTYTIVDGPTVMDKFSSVEGDPLPGTLVYRVIYDTDEVDVRITCPADIDGSFDLDIFDVLAFLGEFDLQTELGDWNGDTIHDIFDVLAYLGDFAAACE